MPHPVYRISSQYWKIVKSFNSFWPENIEWCISRYLHIILAREVYEQAIFISVQKEDIASFERNFSILRTYYDELDPIIGLESQRKYTILGLYLLYLLSFNKISEYHTEIELLPFD